jgi:2,3-bisphosphoglycerate-independent phosphoglycerate mutase
VQRAAALDGSPEAEHTAAVVNELSGCMHRLLQVHPVNQQRRVEGKPPANVVLLRGCGSRLALQVGGHCRGLEGVKNSPAAVRCMGQLEP